MTTYYLPDLTGTNPDYLQVNVPSYVYQSGQKIYFENSPVHASSLVISLVDGTGITLVRNTDWEVRAEDIDQAATARAKLENSAFSNTLVKSVTMKSNVALNKAVAMTYQEFYLTTPGRTFDDGRPLELTPDLIKSLITGLADVRQQVANVNSPTVTNLNTPKLLAFDINKQINANRIVGETVNINTVTGAKVIRLAQGSYFKDSLVIRQNGVALNEATDYTPVVLSSLTDKTTNISGIYDYIFIIKSMSGNITIDYHAVGGDVQPDDIRATYDLMIAIKAYLNDGIFITSETVVETPAFRAFNARLNLLEDGMRRLLTGTPTYGDSSSNNATTRPISAVDSNFHWWTIASLYQVDGSTDIVRADQFKGRVYLPDSKISLAFTVDLNIDSELNKVSFSTETVVFDPKYKLFETVSVSAPQYPMIRVVWNESSEVFSGAYIQFGTPLPNLLDRMVVEDTSTAESCWILSRENEFIVGNASVVNSTPTDSGFTLPDGLSVWSPVSNISKMEVCVPEFDNGYLVYSGSDITVDDLVTVAETGGLFNVLLPNYFPVSEIKTLVVTMISSDSSQVYDVEIPLVGTVANTKYGRMNFIDSDYTAMAMMAKVVQDTLNNIALSINISEIANPLQTGTPSDKTDVVRYVRAKV